MKYLLILLLCCCVAGNSCKKLVETNPPSTQLTTGTVFKNDGAAAAAMNYVYVIMVKEFNSIAGAASLAVTTGLSADEFRTVKPVDQVCYTNSLTAAWKQAIWGDLYRFLYHTNAVIEGVQDPAISEAVRKQLTGEALFMRAFLHFYLTNLYGDVPLVTTTDARINNTAQRTAGDMVYKQIIEDLKQAQSLLKEEYLNPTGAKSTDRVRPNTWTATALLARVYLYTQQYEQAEAEATKLINHTALFGLTPLENVFQKNNRESIWQLQSIANGYETLDAAQLILFGAPNNFWPVYMSPILYNDFETGDQRKVKWTGSITSGGNPYAFIYKYKLPFSSSSVKTEYLVVMRLAEQYLIRAEARAQQGNATGAWEDVNMVRLRAGLTPLISNEKETLLLAIEHERRVELFGEWGHRWLDLKRTGRIDAVMNVVTPQKGGNWQSFQQNYPLPASEIKANPRLLQTPGY